MRDGPLLYLIAPPIAISLPSGSEEGLAVLGLLGAMRGPKAKLAASALAELLSRRRGLEQVSGPCQEGD
jgi:hypothetical protein